MKRYFVYDVYMPGGAKTVERPLGECAKRNFLHAVIHEDKLESCVSTLKSVMAAAIAENKRLRMVEVHLCDESTYVDGYRTIRMGSGYIKMQLVRREIE